MTTNLQQGTLLDVLRKKIRQTKEDMEKFKDECEEYHMKLQNEVKRREEAESEVASLNRRIRLLEENLDRSEERLKAATVKLSESSRVADESERTRKAMENRTQMEDDRVAILEDQLSRAKLTAEEADKKYEEIARKLVLMEHDLDRSEQQNELSEDKIFVLQEELRIVGNNLKSLEVSEEKSTQKEETFECQIKGLDQQLKEALARAELAERCVQKLQKEVYRLEENLLNERGKNKVLQEEMESTLHDIENM